MTTFCKHHHPEMEALVTTILGRIKSAVEIAPVLHGNLRCIVLGGGYGRGEGGVVRTADNVTQLYNDLDLFVFTRKRSGRKLKRQLITELTELGEQLSGEFGIEVEFGPPTDPAEFARLLPTLMYQELLRGWHPVWGETAMLSDTLQRPWNELPLSEGRRLLLNRGTGLLLAREKLRRRPPVKDRIDFAVRNIHKAVLASGDAYLIARGQYCFGGEERFKRLASATDFSSEMLDAYRAALEFKYAPALPKAPDVPGLFQTGVRLWLLAVYDFEQFHKEQLPQTPRELLRNILFNGYYFKFRPFREMPYHPRKRLFAVLPGLLSAKSDSRETARLLSLWGTVSPERNISRYLSLWKRFN